MYSIFVVAILFYISPFENVDAESQEQQIDCNTPIGLPGICIGIRQCELVLSILQSKPLTEEIIAYLRELQCDFEGTDPRVCCPSLPVRSLIEKNNETIYSDITPFMEEEIDESDDNDSFIDDLFDNPLLPSDCGKVLDTKIVGGTRANLDEFPWMALLEYDRCDETTPMKQRSTFCGGVLISKRYVLTAAHCVIYMNLSSIWKLSHVRLGEYDTDTEQDCIQIEDMSICADDPVTVGIEDQIVHERYKPNSWDRQYDIALLRLSRDVVSTNYIKPICLPRSNSFGNKLYVAGWGRTAYANSSNIKLKVSLPLSNKNDCEQIYNWLGVKLGYGQICAGGEKGKGACIGDSGSALMSIERFPDDSTIWSTVGVVSFGPSHCGLSGLPTVYTKVYDFVPWIVSKMRA